MLNYIRKAGMGYLSDMFKKVEMKKGMLPVEFYTCLKNEIRIVGQRIHSIRSYAINQICRMKFQQCMVEHRLEEWMIYSIKYRNKQIYDKCSYLKECVQNVGIFKTRKTLIYPPKSSRSTHFKRRAFLTSRKGQRRLFCPKI